MLITCPACSHQQMDEDMGLGAICEACGWERDAEEEDPEEIDPIGPNACTLAAYKLVLKVGYTLPLTHREQDEVLSLARAVDNVAASEGKTAYDWLKEHPPEKLH